MASPSIRLLRSAIWLASGFLLTGVAAAAPDSSPEPVAAATGNASALSLIADGSADDSARAVGENLYLEVTMNGNPTRKIARFVRDGDAFLASADTLQALGFRLPSTGPEMIDVASFPGVAVFYAVAVQRLDITAPADLVEQELAVLNQRTSTIPRPTASPGLLLNYDLYGTRDSADSTTLSAFTELRAFNAWGVLSNTALSRRIDLPGAPTRNDSVRLDTTFSRSFVDSALTFRAGDILSGNLGWSRATRLGGVQLQSNFALQPDLITFPVPAFYGQANLPSSVDLYIDGLKQYSSDVPAGPFELNTVPTVNGSGQASVVITDALGRQTSVAFPFYTTNALLRPGLSDYSLDLGLVRENYGLRSFDYGNDPALSATWRRGFTNWLTLESHAEVMSGLRLGGAGAVIKLSDAGVVNAAYSRSTDRGASGSQAQLGYEWRNQRLNLSLDTLRTFDDYRDIASRYSLAPPERSDRAQAGLSMGRAGNLGLSYVALEYPDQPRSRYASAYYSRSLGPRVSFNLSGNQNLDDDRDRSVFLAFSVSLDHRISTSLSVQHDRDGNLATVDVHKSTDADGGFGWRVRAQDGKSQHGGLAQVDYRGQNAEVRGGVQSFNGDTLGYAGLSGALVLMNRQLFLARSVYDGFAVVSTDGIAGVPVMLENRPIGATNSRGNLLVTRLNSYQQNKLAIDPMNLPANVDISRVEARAVPSDRAGTLVRFGIQTVRAASVILHDGGGAPLAVGSLVTLRDAPQSVAIVGYDGMVYLEGLEANNVLDVRTPEGSCSAQFEYQQPGDSVPLIGPISCREEVR